MYIICKCGLKVNTDEVVNCPVCIDRATKKRLAESPYGLKLKEYRETAKEKLKKERLNG